MTARRRRKSGSGPSATALIAWVEGTGYGPENSGTWLSDRAYQTGSAAVPPAETRPPLVGRARGLAAGTLLACGSVLAVTVHAADSAGPARAATPDLVTVDPGAVSRGQAATPAVSATTAPPAVTSAQSLGGAQVRAGAVPRNVPRAIDVPRAVSSRPQQVPSRMPGADRGQQVPERDPVERAIEPVTQAPRTVVGAVGDLIAPKDRSVSSSGSVSPTGSVARQAGPASGALLEQAVPAVQIPVEEVLTPLQQAAAPLQDAGAVLDEGFQPALTMLPHLPLG